MKNSLLSILVLCALAFASCTPGEDPITPSGNYSVLRFDFPQGNTVWDEQLQEIHDQYGVYLLYKDINEKDLNKSWTALPTGNLYYGESLDSDQLAYYVDFFKNNLFKYLTPEFTKNSMPIKIYMLDNLRSVPRGIKDDYYGHVYDHDSISHGEYLCTECGELTNGKECGTQHGYSRYFINTRFDGFDYWAVSFKQSEMDNADALDVDGLTPLRKIKRCAFIYKILVNALNNDDIAEPNGFAEGTDYQTAYRTTNPDASNYYKKRGFIDVLTTDFQFNRNGVREAPSLYVSYWRPTQDIEPEVGAHRDFMVYVRAAMFYTQQEFFAKYPAEEYPLIAEKYGMVTDYFRNEVGIDLSSIASGD